MKKHIFQKINRKIAILVSAFFVVSLTAVSIGSSSTTQSVTSFVDPYQYKLTGHGINVVYTPMGPGAVPNLIYKDRAGTKHFIGKNISIVSVENLGNVVGVTLDRKLVGVGWSKTSFAFILPVFNHEDLNRTRTPIPIHTIGIKTNYKEGGATLPVHQIGTSIDTYNLKGTAYKHRINPL
jgi:hypothetical protein